MTKQRLPMPSPVYYGKKTPNQADILNRIKKDAG